MKLAVTHHSLVASGESSAVSMDKPLVFVLDQPKQSKKRKSKGSALTAKSFGSMLDISKFKNARRCEIGWRVRYPKGKMIKMKIMHAHVSSCVHADTHTDIHVYPYD